MAIIFACDRCGKKQKVGEAHGGAEVNCMHCSQLTKVPELEIESYVRAYLKRQEEHLEKIRFRLGWVLGLMVVAILVLLARVLEIIKI